MDNRLNATPLILLVDDQDASSAEIESVLRPKGHVVLRAATGQQALSLTQKVSPDAIITSLELPDMDGIDLVRKLAATPTVYATTPILVVARGSVGRVHRLEALGAGAWDILTQPVDPGELTLRMDTFVRAKQEADKVRDEGLTDPVTGFYNVRGILKRTKEISADAVRFDRPLTCIAFGTDVSATPGESKEAFETVEAISEPVAAALRQVTRISDTVGKLGPGEFVVVAPGTDPDGAVRLADRVMEALRSGSGHNGFGVGEGTFGQFRAGFFSVDTNERTSPEDLLLRATMALRKAQSDERSFRVRAYDA